MIDGNTEAHLGTVDQLPWQVSVEELAQGPFAASIANPKTRRNAPGELHNAMIEERCARLETHPHTGTVYLDQNVVREVHDEIQVHHARQQSFDHRRGG